MLELHPLDGVTGQTLYGSWRRRLDDPGRLDPRIGDRAEVADEVPGRPVRLAPRPPSRQLSETRQAEQPLGDLGLRGEQALSAQAHRLDQAAHEDVGASLLDSRRRGAVELEEGLQPLAGLGRDLWALQRRLAGRDEVELAAPGDRRQPGQIGRAQLDRRSGQRPRRRRRVVWIGQHSQPGDRISHLGSLEESRRPGEMERNPALFHRGGHGPAPRRVVNKHANLLLA